MMADTIRECIVGDWSEGVNNICVALGQILECSRLLSIYLGHQLDTFVWRL
jgi:hypothetical protein